MKEWKHAKYDFLETTMIKIVRTVFALALACLLAACANAPSAPPPPAVKSSLDFIDLEGFDRQLNQSLLAKLSAVDVSVVNATTATAIPVRLQAWLEAVEAGGGTVKVSPPKSNVTAKNPLLLLSLVSGIWNMTRATKAMNTYEFHKPAQAYDAEIVLKIDERGERLLDKIIFTDRKVKS